LTAIAERFGFTMMPDGLRVRLRERVADAAIRVS
jgi:hypothetical protein